MKAVSFLSVIIFFASVHGYASPPAEKGKVIFSTRCAACHNVNKLLTGPALGGVDERRSMQWIIDFVQSSQTVIKNGDKQAVALFAEFNKIPMPDHKDLTAEDISNIVQYIKSAKVSAVPEAAPFRKPGKLRPLYVPLSWSDDYRYFISFFVANTLLVAALLILVNVKGVERHSRNL